MALMQITQPAARLAIHEGRDAVVLSAGALEATFLPDDGMRGVSFRHAGEELLARDGIPLLHPWANRLSADEYELHGRHVHLPAAVQRDERGLPIHGLVGGRGGWIVESLDANRAGACLQASLDFAADPDLRAGFPFAHEVTLDVSLTERALTVITTVEATGGAPVPISFGYHPYLRLPGCDRSRWEVAMPRRRHLELDERGIPTGRGHREAPARFRLGALTFDDAFDGVADGATFSLRGGGRRIAVTHRHGFPVAQVFSPAGAQFICLEPMTAPVDALRTGIGLRRAVPAAPFSAEFSISVEA